MKPEDIMHKIQAYCEEYGNPPSFILLPDDPQYLVDLKAEFIKEWPSATPGFIETGFFKRMFGVKVLEYTGSTIELVHREE